MAFFKYKVKNDYGETVQGKVEAKNQTQAVSILRSRGLLVISASPVSEDSMPSILQGLTGVKQDDIVNFTRQLSTMITAGLPLTEGLSILEKQGKPAMAKVVGDIIREVENGSTFARALERQAAHFSKVYISLVKAGEAGGVLDEVLMRLADDLEKAKEFRAKTKGALIYPVMVIITMLVVVSVLMIFVIPKLTDMYKDFGADLPFVTQLLIDTSSFMAKFWWLGGMAIFGGINFFRYWYKTPAGRHSVDRFMLKLPLFGELRKKMIVTEFARTLSLLLGAGISLLQGLQIVNDAVANIIYKEAFDEAAKQVEKGVSLAQAISAYDIFPPILGQMIAVGEQTGKLDEVLHKLSVYFQSETEQAVKNLMSAMEPMLMVVLGIGVGILMIAIIMPIYNLTNQF